jgi:cyclophilin family peptidyl-prolyl cis-trans isomerase
MQNSRMQGVLALLALTAIIGCGQTVADPPAASVAPPSESASGSAHSSPAANVLGPTQNASTYGPAAHRGGAPSVNAADTTPSRYASAAADAAPARASAARYPSFTQQEIVATISTSAGPISIRLLADKAPLTVDNFLRNYVETAFYEKTVIHYADQSLIAGGGFNGDLAEKPASAPIRNEASNGLKNVRGTVAMGRAFDQIDSATSQFFFNVGDNPEFDHAGEAAGDYGYCVFAEVVSGMDVVDKIARTATQSAKGLENVPVESVVILSVEVKKD